MEVDKPNHIVEQLRPVWACSFNDNHSIMKTKSSLELWNSILNLLLIKKIQPLCITYIIKVMNQLRSLLQLAHKWSCSLHKIQFWTENATDENWFGEKRDLS